MEDYKYHFRETESEGGVSGSSWRGQTADTIHSSSPFITTASPSQVS